MRPLVRALEFRGTAVPLAGGILLVRAASDAVGGAEALLETRITLLDGESFEEQGSISFGGVETIRFRSVRPGDLARTAAPELRHGAVVLAVDRGSGALAEATGLITSNFLLSETGELTDRQLAVLFAGRAGATSRL